MRPYLAILKDSFREALHSRVLWVMFAAITFFLVVLSPLHFRDRLNGGLSESDVLDWIELARNLRQGAPGDDGSISSLAVARIVAELSEKTRENLPLIAGSARVEEKPAGDKPAEAPSADGVSDKPPQPKPPEDKAGGERPPDIGAFFAENERLARLLRDLERAIRDKDFYDAEAWASVKLRGEATKLIERGAARTSDERQRLNRLLLEAACPRAIARSDARAFSVRYLIWSVPWLDSLPRAEVKKFVPNYLPYFFDFFFGSVGIVVALLVAVPTVTQVFEPGSLHVLLSKPISRSALLLSKFIGGCAFTLMGATYLLVGLWLYMGVQLDLWDKALLAGIPIYVCVFAVYFSVAMAAALYWRNAIVAIIVAMLFWTICFALGSLRSSTEFFLVRPSRTRSIEVANGAYLETRRTPMVEEWRPTDASGTRGEWKSSFRSPTESGFMITTPSLGPIYVPKTDELASVQASVFRMSRRDGSLSLAKREPRWPRSQGPRLPLGTCQLLVDRRGDLLVVAAAGVHRRNATTADAADGDNGVSILGIKLPLGGKSEFDLVGPVDLDVAPNSAAYEFSQDRVALFGPGRLTILRSPNQDGAFEKEGSAELPTAEFPGGRVALDAERAVVAGRDGALAIVDLASLKTDAPRIERPKKLEGEVGVRFLAAAPDGKSIVVGYENGRLWKRSSGDEQFTAVRFFAQGNAWAGKFIDGETMVVSHGPTNRVTELKVVGPSAGATRALCAPAMTFYEMSYYGFFQPLYTVFPKPGELKTTMLYLMTGKETVSLDNPLQGEEEYRGNPWEPLVSSLVFMAVVLTCCCVYFEREDL